MRKRLGRYVYVCPACGRVSWMPHSDCLPGKFRETRSLVDGLVYPSCRQVELLCFWCLVEQRRKEGLVCMAVPNLKGLGEGCASSTSNALDGGPLRQFSELWEFLTARVYPDGSERRGGKMSLSCESGSLGLCLTDMDTGAYAFLNGSDLEVLLLEAEDRLAHGTMAFKATRYEVRKKKK